MTLESTFTDTLGVWEIDLNEERFVRKDEEGNINGEAPFDYIAEDKEAPEWFTAHLAEIRPAAPAEESAE
jgi:hypothetical protein